jgi:hypothetical protein
MFKTRERAWSPYVTGIVIGLLLIPAMVVADTVLDPSKGFTTVAGHLIAAISPGTSPTAATLSPESPPGDARNWWPAVLLVGILFGALLSATAADNRRTAPSPIWASVLGSASPKVRAVTGFTGGFLMLFGASLAGGDLTGHGLSGVAQLAVGSIIALVAIVLGGLVMGRLLHRP